MERRRLGNTDMEVSALGYGGSEVGYGRTDPAVVRRLLEEALDGGLNLIDTAACYGDGETLFGEVAHRRGEFYLCTKCGHATGLGRDNWDPIMMRRSIERSLRRLQTDHVDLLQLHSCSEEVLRRGEVIEVLQEARAAGRTRYIGYSGDGADALHAVRSGVFDVLQTSVSIADQQAIDLTLPEAAGRGMGVIAKRPLANVAWRTGDDPPDQGYHRAYWERLRALGYPFLRSELGPAVGVALRFTLSAPGVHTAIVGSAKPGRWAENARLLEAGALPAAEYEAIRARWRETARPDWHGQR